MSDNPIEAFQHYIVAGIAGLLGVYGGVRVHGSKIDDLRDRMERVEKKQDRMLEHFAIKGIEDD